MYNKNIIHNTNNSSLKKLSKKDFTIIYGLTFIVYFFGVYYSKNQSVALTIIGCASIFPAILYFLKIAKKFITESIANKYFGILGIYNAFVCALLLSYQASNTLGSCLKMFVIVSLIIVFIIVLLKIFFSSFFKERKKIRTIVSASFILPFSIAGVLLSKYISSYSMLYEILMGGACFVFAIFYSFLIKYQSMIIKNHSKKSSKNKTNDA